MKLAIAFFAVCLASSSYAQPFVSTITVTETVTSFPTSELVTGFPTSDLVPAPSAEESSDPAVTASSVQVSDIETADNTESIGEPISTAESESEWLDTNLEQSTNVVSAIDPTTSVPAPPSAQSTYLSRPSTTSFIPPVTSASSASNAVSGEPSGNLSGSIPVANENTSSLASVSSSSLAGATSVAILLLLA